MTPEQKAKELFENCFVEIQKVDKYSYLTRDEEKDMSKRVAKFTPNQTLAYLHNMGYGLEDAEVIYWLQVLDEIENI